MASVDVTIAARRYAIACRDGEEAHLRAVAALVDAKAAEAQAALGSLGEARHLLFASLLLADELKEARENGHAQTPAPAPAAAAPAPPAPAPAPPPPVDDGLAEALETLAARLEALADRLAPDAP